MKNFSLSLWPTGLCLESQEKLATPTQLSQGLRRGRRVNGAGASQVPQSLLCTAATLLPAPHTHKHVPGWPFARRLPWPQSMAPLQGPSHILPAQDFCLPNFLLP